LCFLDGTSANAARAYADQGLQVRPYDADVLFEAGYRNLLAGDLNGAFKYWKPSFRHRGKHQLRIIHAVAGPQVPAAVFIQEFQPDWWTLRFVWNRYRQLGQTHDLDNLLAYAAQVSDRQVHDDDDFPPAYIWLGQAQMYSDVDRPSDAAACLEEAYRVAPHLYDVRYALARALIAAGRLPESEPHVRWCLSRHPDSKRLKALLLEINKQRFAQREQASDSR
jgi:tetratricopeptide (TPR) repeat protein